MSELDQFLKDTNDDPNKVDVLEAPLVPEENPEKEELKGEAETGEATTTTENDDELETDLKPRNRRERRLMQRQRILHRRKARSSHGSEPCAHRRGRLPQSSRTHLRYRHPGSPARY
jgi:hypothetical protein